MLGSLQQDMTGRIDVVGSECHVQRLSHTQLPVVQQWHENLVELLEVGGGATVGGVVGVVILTAAQKGLNGVSVVFLCRLAEAEEGNDVVETLVTLDALGEVIGAGSDQKNHNLVVS